MTTTRICPQCGIETQAPFCRADGFATVDSERFGPRKIPERVGETLAGRYQLETLLMRTPFGSAYRAIDLRLQKTIAVRLLADDLVTDLELVARFQREGRLVASLAHPNIVHVMEHGVAEDGTLFIAQELVVGTTLGEALAREGPFDPLRVVNIGRELLDALSEAHAHGVLHRSLGLDNVALVPRPIGGETLKISDFGLVQVLADSNREPFVYPQALGDAWRTMAPEQARGRAVSTHGDIYSVGCILYELLTGTPVFGEGPPSDLLVAHSVKMPPPLKREGRQLGGPLVELILRCLDKKPWNRPDGAQKALDLLELCSIQPIAPLVSQTAEFAAPPARATRAKPQTNPYGQPGAMLAPAPGRSNGASQPHDVPTNPKGLPRPIKPRRLTTAPRIGAAPDPLAPERPLGASAARAESLDRDVAHRPELASSARPLGSADLAPRRRSPVLWFIAGVVVAAGIMLAVMALGRDGDGRDDGGQRVGEPSPRGAVVDDPRGGPAIEGSKPATMAGPDVATREPVVATASDAQASAADAADTAVSAADTAVSVTDTAVSAADTAASAADTAVSAADTAVKATDAGPAGMAAGEVAAPPPATEVREQPSDKAAAKRDPPEPNARTRPRKPKPPADPLDDLVDPDLERTPPASESEFRRVLIDSEPMGATIAINGNIVGVTPLELEFQPGAMTVLVSKKGYRPVKQRLGPTTGRVLRFALVATE